MTGMKERRKRKPVGAWIAAALIALVTAALLELGKHTVFGWIMAAAVFCAFALLHRRLRDGRRILRLAAWAGLLLALAGVLAVSQPPYRLVPAAEGKNLAVTEPVAVAQGMLTGVLTEDGDVEVYAGIPYAAPPVGENRWRAPQPPANWDGVRACDTFAPMSMQPETNTVFASLTDIAVYHSFRISLRDNWREARSEDSLYLNIWKPAGKQEKLPVLVYIHGGSLTTGQPSYGAYNGEAMARDGIIVVNLGYRLGVFGYFADESLAAESPEGTTGNYGLLDQIAALRWIRENISAFGGDPDQVTICGESAGASSVNALCVSPLSEGLFRRAIAESSGITAKVPYHTFRTMSDALETGKQILAEFGCADAQALRAIPATKLVDTKYPNNSMTVDGWAITEQPYLTYEKGENHEEALLSGFNAHEADLFNLFTRVDAADYPRMLRKILGEGAETAAKLLPPEPVDPAYRVPIVERGGDAKGSMNKAYSAAWFTYSHDRWSRYVTAEGRDCWEYYFSKSNGALGANHAGELPYVFGNLDRNARAYDEADRALSETMRAAWVNFVKSGDPNGAGVPRWPRYADAPGQVMEFGETTGMREDPFLPLYPLIDAYQDAEGSTAELETLRSRFPEYFDLSTFKGLEVYVWEIVPERYSCGVLPGTNREKTSEELMNLKAATAGEMRAILSTYDIPKENIAIIPWHHPLSSYKGEYWITWKDEDPDTAERRRQAYVDRIREVLLGDDPVGSLFDAVMSSPAYSSDPGDYLRAHEYEHRQLLADPDATLRYIFSEFLYAQRTGIGQTGLKGHLMVRILDELAPEAQIKPVAETTQAYFDQWADQAKQMQARNGDAWMKANQPAMYLLLQMMEQ